MTRTSNDENEYITFNYDEDDFGEPKFCGIRLLNTNIWTIIDVSAIDLVYGGRWYLEEGEWGRHCSGWHLNKLVKLHRFLTGAKPGEYVDHIDRNGLNNSLSNLRICTNQQNTYNQKVPKNNTSGVIGVQWDKRRSNWQVRIKHNYKDVHLGSYKNFDDAVRVRLLAELKYCGEFAPQRHLFKQYGIE